ncbi:hypothetical protein [Marinobacter changyiensis]|uniref:hypothetical protein n=1 Tax=Marinobacter changyiensis TaxID=2604091 RepID=UPI00126431A3|nr:hypothetical protein [Marinobacter changyiensis]
MKFLLGALMILALLLITGFAHWRIHLQIARTSQRLLLHGLLLTVAIAFGWAMGSVYTQNEEGGAWFIFLYAFGVVHVPAAIILWLKRQQ